MKKCLNISNLLIVLILFSSFGCSSWPGSRDSEMRDPNYYDYLWGEPEQTTSVPVLETVIEEDGTLVSSTLSPAMVSVNKSGSTVVSRTYPWAECGIVQLDKIMPKETELNKPFNYIIKITNLTDTMLSDIVVKEEYPENFRLINTNPLAQESLNTLTWEIDSLGAKSTRQITISGMAEYAQPLQHCTTVQTPVIPSCSTVAVIQPSIKLVKNVPVEAMLCDLIPVKYVVTNDGTGSVSNIQIMDTLPSGLRTTDGKGEISINVGTLVEGQRREYTVELRAARIGTYASKAIASSQPIGLRAESAETSTLVSQPVLAISKIGPERLFIGRPVTYEITVTNKSNVTAKDIVVEDSIPEGVLSVNATEGAQLSESKLIWKLDTLGPNSSEIFRISYTPTQPGVITNGATASGYCAQAVAASIKTIVTGVPAVMLEVGDIDDPVRTGNRTTYLITVTNQGSATSTNIRIACVLENNVKYISSAGSTSGTMEGNVLRFLPLGSLDPQEKAVWRVVVAAVSPGDVRFKVTMNSDELGRPVEETEATRIYE